VAVDCKNAAEVLVGLPAIFVFKLVAYGFTKKRNASEADVYDIQM
jgi:hypothetical protein